MYMGKGIFRINANVLSKKEIMGIPKRNIVEAVIFTIAVFLVLRLIPFTKTAMIMFSIVLCSLTFYFSIRGIANRSITQILIAELKYHKNKCVRHLRGPEYMRKEGRYKNNESSNESAFETAAKTVKKYVNDYIDKYSE